MRGGTGEKGKRERKSRMTNLLSTKGRGGGGESFSAYPHLDSVKGKGLLLTEKEKIRKTALMQPKGEEIVN